MRIPVIAGKTAAETTTFDASPYSRVVFVAYTLAGGETISINIATSGGFVPYYVNAGGAAIGFAGTGTVLQLELQGGHLYQFVKGVTAGACGIDAIISDSVLTS